MERRKWIDEPKKRRGRGLMRGNAKERRRCWIQLNTDRRNQRKTLDAAAQLALVLRLSLGRPMGRPEMSTSGKTWSWNCRIGPPGPRWCPDFWCLSCLSQSPLVCLLLLLPSLLLLHAALHNGGVRVRKRTRHPGHIQCGATPGRKAMDAGGLEGSAW